MSSRSSAIARARARPAPGAYGPNATLSRTVFHGNNEYCWNTMPRSGPGPNDLVAVDPDPAGGGPHVAGHGVEQRRLAAARRTEQAHERARGDVDGRVLERMIGGAVAPKQHRHVPDLDAAESRFDAEARHGPRHRGSTAAPGRASWRHPGDASRRERQRPGGDNLRRTLRQVPGEHDRHCQAALQCRATSASRRSAAAPVRWSRRHPSRQGRRPRSAPRSTRPR